MVRHEDYHFNIWLVSHLISATGRLQTRCRVVIRCETHHRYLRPGRNSWFRGSRTSQQRACLRLQKIAPSENTGVPVEIDGRPILMVYAQIAGFTPQDRAAAIQQRIIALAKRRDIAPEAIRAVERGTWTEIMAGDERIMGVTEADAMAAERRRADLASEDAEIIRLVVKQYRLDHTWQRFFWAVLYSVLATAVVVGSIVILFWIRRRVRSRVEHWLGSSEILRPAPSTRVWLRRYLGQPLVTVGHAGFWVLVLALIQGYGTVVLSFFPSTKYTSDQITNWLFYELAVFAKMLIGYFPNLILILIICLVDILSLEGESLPF